jgi:hypothetical protein
VTTEQTIDTTEGQKVNVDPMVSDRFTLQQGEPHPMAQDALQYVLSFSPMILFEHLEALSSCAIESNRLAEICGETLRRVLHREPVSDRYILGLAFYFYNSR